MCAWAYCQNVQSTDDVKFVHGRAPKGQRSSHVSLA